MELQCWKKFKNSDSNFVTDVKRAYFVGITSVRPHGFDDDIEGNVVSSS